MLRILITFICVTGSLTSFAQPCNTLNFKLTAEIPSNCNTMTMNMLHDQNDRPFLYVANKEGGLNIFDIQNIQSPQWIAQIKTLQTDSLEVMAVAQQGLFLFLTLGNHFTNPQKAGMAIVNISNPGSPVVTDTYVLQGSGSGGGIIVIEGNYAYMGAMKSGLLVLDISNKSDIQLKGQLIPDINYPVKNPNADLYNARGMAVKNGIVYLCYDAGGIRVINCSKPTQPVETGRFCNPAMYLPLNRARAYNNCVLNDTLLYVTVDYAGVEILSVKDTSKIRLLGWWNPYNAPNSNWFTSPSHTNELEADILNQHLFISTGKSDMIVLDVSNPADPDSCNTYGGISNDIGTWGISMYKNHLFLSYICALIPFSSNWTGVKILEFNRLTDQTQNFVAHTNHLYPNPVSDQLIWNSSVEIAQIKVYNVQDQELMSIYTQGKEGAIDVSQLNSGVFQIELISNNVLNVSRKKFIKY